MTVSTGEVVDLFAGPGGWSEALRMLGLVEVGYEKDKAACDTAGAAGHVRVQEDVSRVDLGKLRAALIVAGLIASPPCQAWSRAGKRKGILDQPRIFRFLRMVIKFAKTDPSTAYELASAQDAADNCEPWHDDRSRLVLEPVRWALALNPRWVACEQVPDVLPFWELFAVLLRQLGYSVWTGLLSSERYGVAQTRLRAILAASLDREMREPPATHFAYNTRGLTQDGLFKLDLLPWVSMADALGIHLDNDWLLRSNYGTGGDPANRGIRTLDEPAPTVTGKVDRNKWVMRSSAMTNATVRSVDEPAPTITAGHDRAERVWVVSTGNNSFTVGPGQRGIGGERDWRSMSRAYERSIDDPAPTVDGKAPGAWAVHPSGARTRSLAAGTAVRVTVAEAAILQSFRPDYPWRGSKTAQYRQVGDAIPPLVAVAVLGNLLGLEWQHINRAAYRSGRAA